MILCSCCISRGVAVVSPSRRGAVIIVVLLGLLLIGLISGSLFKLAFAQRSQTLREQIRVQCDWLAESGCDRAAAQLAGDASYRGETWEIPAEIMGGHGAAIVEIDIGSEPGESVRRLGSVVATYPRDSVDRARVTRYVAWLADTRGSGTVDTSSRTKTP